MTKLSQSQLLALWSELTDAYYGHNGYGGNTAEIYAYTLHRHDPRMTLDGTRPAAEQETGMEAAASLRAVIRLFRERYDCVVKIDGQSPTVALAKPLVHRCHIRVMPKHFPGRHRG